MNITRLKTNRLTDPLGFELGSPRLSWVVADAVGKRAVWTRVEIAADPEFTHLLHDSGRADNISGVCYTPGIALMPRTRYYWRVSLRTDAAEEAVSDAAWFETGLMDEPWSAEWITPQTPEDAQPAVYCSFPLRGAVRRARAYATGLGVYELYINGQKAGEEYLAPFFNDYADWIQYQTYDITAMLGEDGFTCEFALGNGWYKGRAEREYPSCGSEFACLGQIEVEYEDGQRDTFVTSADWRARLTHVTDSGIYFGQDDDYTRDCSAEYPVRVNASLGYDRLEARLSPPLTMHERIKPVAVITTPKGETVLDMGQNMVGWMEFVLDAPRGAKVRLSHGELLQDGCFYRDNLRKARAEYHIVSDGQRRTVHPRFTFFGFRYVRVEGMEVHPEDFTGCVLHSDLEETGSINTSDELINRLFQNVRWGQKGNFVDTPTDCPQRDERMGWTGDAQIFCGTACFNMDAYAFYTKYAHDVAYEQARRNGDVPVTVPANGSTKRGSTAWGEAATVIPWQLWLHYGDREILRRQFASMKGWVDSIRREDDASGGRRLWTTGYHFGDWLALDGIFPGGVYGGTDPHYIASCYYCHSALLVSRAAAALGMDAEAAEYAALSQQVKAAVQDEYFTPTGRLSIDTQTAHVLALYFDICPEDARPRIAARLRALLRNNGYKLDTGFVGTPYLCRVLSENGMNDVAYTLLMNREFPSWIYEVLMGATTIWERWNSVLPDGHMSSTGMNSLNHYSYGSIAEWMYRCMAGISPDESAPGFRRAVLRPMPSYQLSFAEASVESAAGRWYSRWELVDEGHLRVGVTVPFGAEATLILPHADASALEGFTQLGPDAARELDAGSYVYEYALTTPCRRTFSLDSGWRELLDDERAREVITSFVPRLGRGQVVFGNEMYSLRQLADCPFLQVPRDVQEEMDEALRAL